jgi:GGDEF domain-containing protein
VGILYNLDWHQATSISTTVTSYSQGLTFMITAFFGISLLAMAFFNWGRKRNKDDMAGNSQRALLSTIPSYQSTLPYMTFELTRARRYNHTLSVLILGLDTKQKEELLEKNKHLAHQWANEHLASKFLFSLIGTIIRESLRDSDILSYEVIDDRFIILLTDTDEDKANNAVVRLNELVHEQIQTQLRAGIAEFPSNGLTIEDLVKYAQTRFYHQPSKNGVMAIHRKEDRQESQPERRLKDTTVIPATMGKNE